MTPSTPPTSDYVRVQTERLEWMGRAERAEARAAELERERDDLHAAFPIYDSLARAEVRVARLEEALREIDEGAYSGRFSGGAVEAMEFARDVARRALAHEEEK